MTFGAVRINASNYGHPENRVEFRIYKSVSIPATIEHVAKQLTEEKAQARKDKGVQFLRDVVGDDDAADNLDDEDLDSYIERKHIQIVNKGASKMANGNADPRTKSELLDEIVAPPDEGDDEGDDDDDSDDDQ